MSADPIEACVDELCRRVTDVRGDLRALADSEVGRVAPLSSSNDQSMIVDRVVARLDGLGELARLLEDPSVDEVLVNNDTEIWVERAGSLERAGTLTHQRLEHLAERILAPIGRRLDRTSPVVDARLPDGSRVCVVIPPVAVSGAHLSIRRFGAAVRPLCDFTNGVGVELCQQILAARCNVVVCGATSSGKTSLVSSMLSGLTDGSRVVVLEDTSELIIQEQHVIRMETRPPSTDGPPPVDLSDLLRAALRLRPDRIVVGEIRGHEVLGLVQAMNTGHDGSWSTVHANGPLDALHRLESLVLQAAPSWPLVAIRAQLRRSIDVVIHVDRDEGGRRAITSISEVMLDTGPDGEPRLSPIAERSDRETLQLCGALARHR